MNLFKVARNAVSKDKFRFQDGWFDLDLTYITSRIIAMGIPGQKMDKIWRNDGDDVATFLWFYHAKHFMVFNLSGEEYDYAKFDNRVLDFGFPDHSACPLALLFQIVEAMKKWLSEDEENVAVVHCLAGRGRTGMVISTYLLREGFFRDAKAALKFFAEARSATAAGVLTPSQIRYAHYANEIYRGRIDPPFGKERPLVLKKIVISPFPVIPDADDVQRMGGWEPVIKVLTLQGHHKDKNNERLLYSSDYHPTKLYYSKPGNIRVVREVDNGTVNREKERIRSKLKQKEKIVVDITKGCFVRGDIQLKFFHQASSRISFARILKSGYLKPVEVLSTALSKKYPYICLFRLSFHTSFVGRQLNEIIAKQQRESGGTVTTESMGESNDGSNGTVSWTLRKEELDAMFSGPAHTKMLPDDFAIKLVFGYPDTSDDTPGSSSTSSASSSSSPSSSPSPSASASSMRGSGGSRSTPSLPLPALPSVDGTTSAVASLALSPRGLEQREKLAQRRTGDGRPNARATVNFSGGGGKYKEAELQPPPSRGQRGTISYSSIKRHATGPLQNERKAQQQSIDFEDIFLKTPTPPSTASSRDHSAQRISESTEPTFPPASAMRRRSSLPSSSAQHAADAAAATAAMHKKSVTPSPSRPNPSTRPDFPSTQTRGSSPSTERDASPTHRVDIMASSPALTSSLHSPLRPTPPSSSSSSSSLPFSTSPPPSMTPPSSGGSLSSNGQATTYAYPPSAIAAAAASHNRQSLLQSYPPTHPVLTPTPASLAPVSAPVPSPSHTAVLTPTPSHPAVGGGGPPGQGLSPTHPHSAPAQFVAGDGSAQLHMPLTPVSVRPGASNPLQPLHTSSGVSLMRGSMAIGHGHVPLQPTLGNGSDSNGNVGQLPSYAQQPQPQHHQPQPRNCFALHPPLQPVPVMHQDFSSRLPPVRFPPPASSTQSIDEAQRERIRQQIIAERQRALYPQQPQTQPSQVTQSQPQYHQPPQQPERARDQSNANAVNTERRRQQEDERMRRDSWERERATAADRDRGRGGDGRDRGEGGRGGDSRGGGRGGAGDGRPRGGAPRGGGGSGNGGRGGGPPAGSSPRRTYHISEML